MYLHFTSQLAVLTNASKYPPLVLQSIHRVSVKEDPYALKLYSFIVLNNVITSCIYIFLERIKILDHNTKRDCRSSP